MSHQEVGRRQEGLAEVGRGVWGPGRRAEALGRWALGCASPWGSWKVNVGPTRAGPLLQTA